jgi:hypothetical protein
MAESKGVDPFEAFKQKKAAAAKQSVEQSKMDEASRKAGWIDGIGPAEAKPLPGKPKGFNRGRYTKPPLSEAELAKLRPEGLEETQLAKPKATDTSTLPPVDKRRPKKFGKY